ncbi:succinate dehydrogenase hydrophobic anchor subunit [Nocardioides thalensis]|uniref:Succinate dehydrogenase hydrophobic anchor subunit n=1 Tax=Nocardioides thalensis TaxID=1914755 RepID=A0A853BZG3_9ACTN|nr:DUF1353 domain-containing protein [Nocardioides thalensis]NYJ00277.1 succinate dehydrogenase hydrophobic anchor subunit [Nocardioides thalensis]
MRLGGMDLHPAAHPGNFFDGGTDVEDPDRDRRPRIVLERDDSTGTERWAMERRLAYEDEVHGIFLVPDVLGHFRTDLASVPAIFTWLVPKTGKHLAPALVHDALVHDRLRPQLYRGQHIDRVAADEVFRRAMRDSGTATGRRWLVWSAVTLGTIKDGSEEWSRGQHLRYALTALGTLVVIAALGVVATLDLADVVAWLPWMGESRSFALELVGGLAGAIVIPLLLAATWGRFWIAGAITGVALAVLLHATVLLGAITLGYQAVEWVARRRPMAVLVTSGLVVAAFAVLTVLLVGSS